MLDVDTFLTTLYVIVDDFCQSQASEKATARTTGLPLPEPGNHPHYLRPLVEFASERDFYRYAEGHLRGAFPTLPGPLPVQPSRALLCGDHGGDRREAGEDAGGQGLMPTKHSIVLRCPSGTQSAGDMDGSPDEPTSAGLIA